MTETSGTVIVVDDDAAMREALQSLLTSVDLDVILFGSVQELLKNGKHEGPCCMVLDVRLPGQSGLDLQDELIRQNNRLPIIFITGHGDIPMTVRAMKAGAVEFLAKPFRDQDLLDAVRVALERDRSRRDEDVALRQLRDRFDALTSREREVMALVSDGMLNKQIASHMGVSEVTVKGHRGQVMRKMGARSVADLVRMADRLKGPSATQ
jgi:FixJ family two-component response regulator